MRFIGNKELIIPEILDLLKKKKLLNKNLTFFDAFCGTGAVSDALKDSFNLIVNDLLNWAGIYTMGRICASDCKFKKLGFDPFYLLFFVCSQLSTLKRQTRMNWMNWMNWIH